MKNIIKIFVMLLTVFYGLNMKSQSWERQYPAVTDKQNAIYVLNKDTSFIVCDNGKIQKTQDGGLNWTLVGNPTTDNLYDIIFINNDTACIIGANGLILKSVNGGSSWTNVTQSITDKNLYSASVDSNNDIWMVGEEGKILLYNVIDDNITSINSGTNNRLNSIVFTNNGLAYISGNGGILLKSEDGGQSWSLINVDESMDLFGMQSYNDNIWLLAGDVDINYMGYSLYSNSSGVWETISTIETPIQAIYNIDDSTHITASTYFITKEDNSDMDIILTEDNFETWEYSFRNNGEFNFQILNSFSSCIDIGFVDSNIGFVLGDYWILKTINGGIPSSVSNSYFNKPFLIFPNPADNYISFRNTEKIKSIKILNLQSKIVKEFMNDNIKKMNISDLPSGLYFVMMVYYNDQSLCEKIIKL